MTSDERYTKRLEGLPVTLLVITMAAARRYALAVKKSQKWRNTGWQRSYVMGDPTAMTTMMALMSTQVMITTTTMALM